VNVLEPLVGFVEDKVAGFEPLVGLSEGLVDVFEGNLLGFNAREGLPCRGHGLDWIAERTGIADGGELEFRPPGTAAWLFDKVKY
jgi:hypothetical protein